MPELSDDLKKMQTLRGAFDIIRYLAQASEPMHADDICDDLDMSDRRFGKAIKRLATRSYVQMNSEREYFLAKNGIAAAEELAAFDAAGGETNEVNANKVMRRLLLALPRELTAGQSMDMHIGIDRDGSQGLSVPADIVVRISAVNAQLTGSDDEIMKLSNESMAKALQITPEMYSQVRIKVQVVQIAPNGEDITMCGGMYVDVNVATDDSQNSLIAYAADIALDPV